VTDPGERVVLTVVGMNCTQCGQAVESVLHAVPGVSEVSVDVAGGTAVVQGDHLCQEVLSEVVREAGFDARPAVLQSEG